jgi:hypothetical protein
MAKVHLAIRPYPIVQGVPVEAFCGEIVPKAEAIPLVTGQEVESQSTLMFCKTCFGDRYHYFIVAGQEGFDERRKHEELQAA